MTAWLTVVPGLLLTTALLLVPGLAGLRAAGLRGPSGWGAAPALSLSAVAVGAVLAAAVGLPWGWATASGCVVLGAGLTAAARVLPDAAADERPGSSARAMLGAVAGAAAGGLLVLLAVARGLGSPGALSQTFDAVFHLNAVRWVMDQQDGSSLHLAAAAGGGRDGFYPAAFHDLAALVATLRPEDLPLAVNTVAVAAAAVAWPLGCAALADAVLGRRWAAAPGVAGLLSAGFTAFPYLLLSFGVLWPNALAGSVLPGVLALLVRAVRPGAWRTRVLALGCLPGLALAHPNAVFALLVLAFPLLALTWADRVRGAPPERRTRLLATAGAAVLLLGGGAAVLARSATLQAVFGADWPARESVAQATGEVILNAQARGPALWVLSGLTVLGAVAAWRRRDSRWLVPAHLVLAALYVLAAGSDSTLSRVLTGVWYNDSFRLAALVPVTAVALATAGVLAVAGRLAAVAPRAPRTAVLAAVLAVVAVTSGGLSARDHVSRLRPPYASSALVGPAERALLERLPSEVPADAVIVGNPWNGSALSYALGGRRSLFPHLSARVWDADRELVASRLDQVAAGDGVCAALQRLGVRWALGGSSTFWRGDRRQAAYAGLTDLAGRPGLREVDRGGRLTLYEVTACGAARTGVAS